MRPNHPLHLHIDNAWYLVTAATVDHDRLLSSETVKALICDELKKLLPIFGCKLLAWVILDDHYHLLLKVERGEGLARLIGRLHGVTARRATR